MAKVCIRNKREELERLSGLSSDEAKQILLDEVRKRN